MKLNLKISQKLTLTTLLVLGGFTLPAQELLQAPFYVATGANAGAKVNVFDGAVEKYNGFYYLFGTGNAGKVYSSTDLINWGSAVSWMSTSSSGFPSWVTNTYYLSNGYEADRYAVLGDAGDMFFHNGVMFWLWNTMAFAGFNPSTLNDSAPVG